MLKMKTTTLRILSRFPTTAIKGNELKVSFDVTSLYTNIPIIDTLNIIKDSFNNDYQFTRKTTIPQDKFLDLDLELVLTTTSYNFSSQFYQQTDDVAMGGPASSTTTAEIYM